MKRIIRADLVMNLLQNISNVVSTEIAVHCKLLYAFKLAQKAAITIIKPRKAFRDREVMGVVIFIREVSKRR